MSRDDPAPDTAIRLRSAALVGNPNAGKSALFNALTGARQKIANYPGVTVERKAGRLALPAKDGRGDSVELLDLPGSYSFDAASPDEAVTRDVVTGEFQGERAPDVLVIVLDAANLEQHLVFAQEVLELGRPTVVALNMIDLAERDGLTLDPAALSDALGVPVIPMQANTRQGMERLRVAMSQAELPLAKPGEYPPSLREVLAKAHTLLNDGATNPDANALAATVSLLCSRDRGDSVAAGVEAARELMERDCPGWEENLVLSQYTRIGELTRNAIEQTRSGDPTPTDKLDRVLLHPILGWLILGGLMTALFATIFSVVTVAMDWIDTGSMLERVRFSQSLAQSSNFSGTQWDFIKVIRDQKLESGEDIIDHFDELLFQGTLSDSSKAILLEFINTNLQGETEELDPARRNNFQNRVKELLGLILSLPEWHFQ